MNIDILFKCFIHIVIVLSTVFAILPSMTIFGKYYWENKESILIVFTN